MSRPSVCTSVTTIGSSRRWCACATRNTLIVVEHDEDTIRVADWVVDIGPGAGEHGGQIVVVRTVDDLLASKHSITGDYLSGRRAIPVPDIRRMRVPGHELTIHGACTTCAT